LPRAKTGKRSFSFFVRHVQLPYPRSPRPLLPLRFLLFFFGPGGMARPPPSAGGDTTGFPLFPSFSLDLCLPPALGDETLGLFSSLSHKTSRTHLFPSPGQTDLIGPFCFAARGSALILQARPLPFSLPPKRELAPLSGLRMTSCPSLFGGQPFFSPPSFFPLVTAVLPLSGGNERPFFFFIPPSGHAAPLGPPFFFRTHLQLIKRNPSAPFLILWRGRVLLFLFFFGGDGRPSQGDSVRPFPISRDHPPLVLFFFFPSLQGTDGPSFPRRGEASPPLFCLVAAVGVSLFFPRVGRLSSYVVVFFIDDLLPLPLSPGARTSPSFF